MAKEYTITKEEGIKRICEAIREAYAISDAIDDEHLATNSTFSSAKIDSLLSDIDTRVDKLENGSGSGGSGGSITIDNALSDTSENAVQNKVITVALKEKASKAKYDDTAINIGRKDGTVIGDYSVAIGVNVEASGNYAHAEGYNTKASGDYSYANGWYSEATGKYSFAIGGSSQAIGMGTFAGGIDCQAIGGQSFVYGDNLIANHSVEVAFGEYNQSNVDTLFSIGNGGFIGGDGEGITRRNAFEITTDGGKLHGKDIVTDLIQRGTVSGTTISITFDKSFKDTPTVVCTVCNSSPSAYYISNKSTTGFTITSNASQTYDWIAIGDAATE